MKDRNRTKERMPGTEIQVYIGDEAPVQTMKDCSVVTANYVLGDGLRGTIGIVGPKRMDYEKVVSTLRNLVNQLNETFKHEKVTRKVEDKELDLTNGQGKDSAGGGPDASAGKENGGQEKEECAGA